MREILIKKIELSNGETIQYRFSNGGENTLILVHGNMNSSVNWDLLMENLSEDITVYAVDLRGFGGSSYHKPVNSIKDLSDDIKLFADALDLKKFTLSGWSLGGAVVMQFAIDYPNDLDQLVLLASSSVKGFPVQKRNFLGRPKVGQFLQTKEEMAKFVKPVETFKNKNMRFMLKKLLNKSLYSNNQPDENRYKSYLDDMIAQRNLADVNYALMTFNISDGHNGVIDGTNQAHLINVPTLIIQGDQDVVVPLIIAKSNKEAIGDNATLKVIEGAGHSPLLDDLEKTKNLYENFILKN